MTKLRKTVITAISAVALIASTSLVAPVTAQAHHRVGWFLGGLAAGAVLGHAARVHAHGHFYGSPVYYAPPHCWWTEKKVWDPYYGWTWHRVKVCR